MSESKEHKMAKEKAAGKRGRTEVPLKGGRRLDALNEDRATEVERSGSRKLIKKALSRLEEVARKKKELHVPIKDLAKARKSAKNHPVVVKEIRTKKLA